MRAACPTCNGSGLVRVGAQQLPLRPLPDRQRAVFEVISTWNEKHARPITLSDLGAVLKLNSVATVHQHVQQLIRKGYVERAEEPGWAHGRLVAKAGAA